MLRNCSIPSTTNLLSLWINFRLAHIRQTYIHLGYYLFIYLFISALLTVLILYFNFLHVTRLLAGITPYSKR